MDLIKITLFLVFVTISQGEQHKVNDYIGHDADLDDSVETTEKAVSPSRRFFGNHKRKNCMCLPKSSSRLGKVTDQIDPGSDSSYERLVVFIYKNTHTNEYKIYIPDERRQRVFPEIDYEITDILRNDESDIIKSLFQKVLSDVRWISVRINNPPTTPKPIDLHPHKNVDKHGIDGEELINDMVNHGPERILRILELLNRFKETKHIIGSLTGETLHEKLSKLRKLYPIIFRNFMTKIRKFYPTWLTHGHIIRFKPGHLQRFPYDIKFLNIINGKRVIINGQLQPHKSVKEIIVYTPKRTIIEEIYPQIFIDTNLSFDQWFEVILKGLNVQLNFVSKVIDNASLKAFILDVLNKHKITIDAHGHLKNSYGLRVKLSNLILRPILIGEGDLINSVINKGLLKIPSGVVFIEALLISGSSIDTLGVIPISHILVGREEIITETTTVEVIETITTCENGVCKSKKICRNIKGVEKPCKFTQSRSAAPDENESESPVPEISRSGCKDKKHCKKCKHKHCEDQNEEPSLINVSISDPFIVLGRNGNDISPTEQLPDSDEELDIRIIGGNAATNSGTPVSSKGRSGY